jgi:hypothetical protein
MLKAGYAKGLPSPITAWCKESRNYCYIQHNWPEPFNAEQRLIRALYRSVILQAIQDINSKSHKQEAKKAKAEAIAWVDTEDFREVCLRAGWTPEFITNKMNAIIVNGYCWRKPAGTGWRVQKRLEQMKQRL